MPEKAIAHEPERRRYELRLDDRVAGVAEYAEEGKARAFTHTEVDPGQRGRGLAAELVEFALRDTEDAGLQALPYCWYVRDHIDRHRRYLDLVPAERRGEFALSRSAK